jgi:predicted PurR-regulated permease PerM
MVVLPKYASLSISTGTLLRFFAIILGLVLAYYIYDILLSLICAVIIASAVEPAIMWFRKYGIPRILGTILVYLIIAGFFVSLFYLIFPILTEEFRVLSTTYPQLQQNIAESIKDTSSLPLFSFFANNTDALLKVPSEYLGNFSGGPFGIAATLFGGLFSFGIILVSSFYLAAQEKGIEAFLRLTTPLKYETYVINLWERSQRKLGKWLQAQLLLGAIVGVFIFFGLTFLGVRQAFLFALLAGLFEIIPIAGPILAAIPAVATAFLDSSILGILTLLLYVAVQQTESHVIVPVVMRRVVGLSPLIVVMALLIGARLAGILGILLAVPLTAVFAEFIDDWDKKKRGIMPE